MSTPAILAIDQGTTNTKALLFDPDGALLADASRPTQLAYPRPGWAEADAEEIWRSVSAAIEEVVAQARAKQIDIRAIGIANQRETVLLWDRDTGRPVGPAILWQCRRTAATCAALRAQGHEEAVATISGLGLDPLFSATKLHWLLMQEAALTLPPALRMAGTIDSWLLWKLTGGRVHATDPSNAARTQLMALETRRWSDELAAVFDVPLAILPEIRPSDSVFGTTGGGSTALPDGIPIRAVMGDSHAALHGHAITAPGRAKVTLGTGSSLMAPTAGRVRSHHGLSSTIAWQRGDAPVFALEGNITVSGGAAAFGARLLGLPGEAALGELAATVADAGGVTFVPALAGLGAPHWQPEARGILNGLSLGTTPAHIARAVFDGIAMQIADVVEALEADAGTPLPVLSVDGGAARNEMLLGLIADATGCTVERPALAEASAFGAARMAGEAAGIWRAGPPVVERRFQPSRAPSEREASRARWKAALRRAT